MITYLIAAVATGFFASGVIVAALGYETGRPWMLAGGLGLWLGCPVVVYGAYWAGWTRRP